MSGPRTLPTEQSTDLVTIEVFSDGEKIPASVQVLGIGITKSVNRIPFASLVIKDGDPSKETFEASTGELFAPGRTITLTIGYHNDNETMFKGVVVRHRLSARKMSGPVLQVECKDAAFKMTGGRQNRFFKEVTDSEIIRQLLDDYELEHQVEDDGIAHFQMIQYHASDWDFMLCRAEMNGYVVIVDDGKVHVVQPDLTDPVLDLTFGATILEFEAGLDIRQHSESIESCSWNIANQEIATSEASQPLTERSNGATPGSTNLRHSGFRTDAELQKWVQAAATKSRLTEKRGSITCQGFGKIKPGDTLRLHGLGDRFEGNVFISGVSHRVTTGKWYTDIEFGLSPQWFHNKKDISDSPASGMLPAVHGLQVGVIRLIEGDPEGEERLCVSIPIIDQEDDGVWARLLLPDAGNGRGVVFRPEIGDEVMIGFVNDDPRDAVVLGVLHSGTNPSPIPASDDNFKKGIVTKSGLSLMFNDEDESIQIKTPAGNMVLFSDSEDGIEIKDQHQNRIRMDGDGIQLDSSKDLILKAAGDILVNGMNIELDASAEMKAKGGASTILSSNGITNINGSMVKIN